MLKQLIEKARSSFDSYEELAEKLGTNKHIISDWKAGRRKPSTFQICLMAEIAELNVADTLFQTLKSIDTVNAEAYEFWRPHGDSNPGTHRERVVALLSNGFVKFCNFIARLVKISEPVEVYQVKDERIFELCEHQNDPVTMTHDRAVHLRGLKNWQMYALDHGF